MTDDTTATDTATTAPAPEILRYSAFTRTPEGGNPAGVVLDASRLDAAAMLAVAAEVGYSETAFVTAADPDARRFTVRYFSPLAEVAFCGHATVALAVALADRLGPGDLILDTPAGAIAVTTATDGAGAVRATLTSVPTRSRPALAGELEAALAALGWSASDLDPALPPHVAFGGNDHLVLAAASRERLAALDYDFDALAEVMRRYGPPSTWCGASHRAASTPATRSPSVVSWRTRRRARRRPRSAATSAPWGWSPSLRTSRCGRARTWAARATSSSV